jgi:hypothetical protein
MTLTKELRMIRQNLLSAGLAVCGAFVVSASPALAEENEKSFDKSVLSGKSIEIETYRHLLADCGNAGYVEIKVTQPPRGGSVKFARGNSFSAFAADNARAKCNSRKSPSVTVTYQARKDFSGPDEFNYEVFWVDGDVWKRSAKISVR